MTQQEKLQEEAAICRQTAERVQDLNARLALLELADWWTMQADGAARESQGAQISKPGAGRTRARVIERA